MQFQSNANIIIFFQIKTKIFFLSEYFLLFSKNKHILINANIIIFFQIKTNIFFVRIFFTVFKEQSHFNQMQIAKLQI